MSDRTRTVRCKFKCTKAESRTPGNVSVEFEPYYEDGDDAVNKSWAEATPSGKLEMWISNPNLCEHFVAGKQYLIDITLAPPEEQDSIPDSP